MGVVHADFTLTNFFNKKSVRIRALVDTGATEVFVTPEVARELGFDPEEVAHRNVTVADGRSVRAPRLRPVEIEFADRSYCGEVLVLGDQCLVGVIPLEAMDLVVDPKHLELIPNPAHPDGPYTRA